MERKHITLLVVGGVVLALGIGLSAGPISRWSAAKKAAEEAAFQEWQCGDYLDHRATLLVKNCLAENRLQSRRAEAQALVEAEANARTDAVSKLSGNPSLIAMIKKWVEKKKSEPALSIWLRVVQPAPLMFTYGGSHTASFPTSDIAYNIQSELARKVPGMAFAAATSGCDAPAPDPHLDATVVLHEGTNGTTLRAGQQTVGVRELKYDIDVVACYEGERVSLASVKAQSMPLHDNYKVKSDTNSAPDMAYQDMDHAARSLIESIFKRALGI